MKRQLPRCHRTPAQLLLRVPRFSSDALLIAADAYQELADHHTANGAPDLAQQANNIARALINEAPKRAPAVPLHFPRKKGNPNVTSTH
ncbi:hypothetical protein NKW53_05950 [Acetobacter orientalis]|uniref:hypothetical protein n=1 Tax=Acetobacter orientalis TaxID=146474 RepID=UPI0020A02115|nr:hypothetical protein [Acetobacter orientalis]MCP1215609.1 hypothetical protein [Acetobacter orientalis]MCP1217538.1 hypothetical protein [Acetobacter orientalis]